ncbi:BREX-1 system phosphatase PglZ type A [Oribacterium sp. WCC10]|uniref:BREX-1 system phosphatase PglZ type A n=1 Tax=Oribacterium sp. WCC10 TaxID=1855343 RepID=UPI0008F32D2C|nr:BREX-1 system phosphatase PglZ type A [Oribacterium sp. WCC10]SFG31028.1 TIGR02687 family protein [Oribacterium sp. WCC10]
MAELNLKQIIDRLNTEFTGDVRKLVFWYDDKAEFEEDIDSVELENAKVYKLKKDNQFYTKYFLEREDTTTNYLIYAPFPKPDVKDNHLEDTLLYSKRFFADRASLLSVDLGIEEKYKHVIEKHIKFFGNKDRTQRFYDLEIENFNEENILVGLLSAVCKTKTCSFEEVVRIVITQGDIEDNKYLEEMDKYELLGAFWRLCEQQFGYIDPEPTLERLIVTLFVTYADRYIRGEVPVSWRNFVSMKQGNVIAFLDNMMNSILFSADFDRLSQHVATGLKVKENLSQYSAEDIIHLESFSFVDELILRWMTERILSEDVGAKLDELSLLQICDMRSKMHFGELYRDQYAMLENALSVVNAANYGGSDDMRDIVKKYESEDHLIDRTYRKFYFYHDKLEDTAPYEKLQSLVENIYTNEYLNDLIPRWNSALTSEDGLKVLPLQRNFYSRYVNQSKERTVVIISDAMRYEVGYELLMKMKDDPRCTAKLSPMMSSLPSYTRLGMAALLPHDTLEMRDDYEVYADGILCNDLAGRQTVLQRHCKDSVCVQFDDIKNLKKTELRNIFTGKQIVYVYHNQIDARGDKPNTEDEVFVACDEAIREIVDLMHKITINANTYKFIVTSDHGFIYKRDKLSESDKIGGMSGKDAWINRRYIVSKTPIQEDGISNIGLGYLMGNDDDKVVSFPSSSNVFKVSGGGQNYVHGGSSPQEMIIPVLELKMERGHMETKPVSISLVSMIQKITNLITGMDFIQSEPVSDTVKETTYRLLFESEDGERISNENIYVADSREPDSAKRIFRMRFNFKNQKYDKNKQYYLVVTDDNTGLELFRHSVIMDLTFADDFNW